MPGNVEHRTVSGIMALFRTFLRGKWERDRLRFPDEVAARTQPNPTVPGGPYHKSTKIYYFTRDARREVKPPVEIPTVKELPAGEAEKSIEFGVAPNKYRNLGEPTFMIDKK